jgi:hypothetical protein
MAASPGRTKPSLANASCVLHPAAIFGALCEQNHQCLLLTAISNGLNGHSTTIKHHANGKYYVQGSLQTTVAELIESYPQRVQESARRPCSCWKYLDVPHVSQQPKVLIQSVAPHPAQYLGYFGVGG